MNPVALSTVIGRAVHDLRLAQGVTADQVARAARNVGLSSWLRSTVATLETGGRGLTAEEFVLLPLIMTDVLGRPVGLAELMPQPAKVGRLLVKADMVGCALDGTLQESKRAAFRQVVGREVTEQLARRGGQALSGKLTEGLAEDAVVDQFGEAEQKAARKLGRTALQVAAAAHERYGRTLTDERDRLLAERVGVEASPETVRAVRGRITRILVAELAADLVEQYPKGDD